MKSNTFGLDIGTGAIKVVWLEKQGTGYTLKSVLSAPTPAKGMLSESPLDQEELAQTINKVISDAGISARLVNIALPESQVFTRVIEMPVLSDKELASAIYFEAEQYIPVPLQTITLDYKVLHRPEAGDSSSKMDVLLVGAPTTLIDKYEKLLALANISLASVETEVLALSRSVALGADFPSSLLINIGAVSTSLAIIKNGFLVFIYSMPTGGNALSRAIAADFGFSIAQADEYKKAYGLLEGTFGGKIGKAAEPVLALMLTETRKALAFYNEKFINDPVKQIVLSGGTAKLPGLDIFFSSNTGIETVTANPWKVLTSQNVPKDVLDDAPEYAIAVGLAMRDYE